MPTKRYESIVLLLVLMMSLALCVIYKQPMAYGLLVSVIVTLLWFVARGFWTPQTPDLILQHLRRVVPVILILGSIGMLIALWMHTGVLASLLTLGFKVLGNAHFLLNAFLMTLILSMLLGTAIGTIGIVGVLLIGMASAMQIPSGLVVGAMVSGAYFGDRTSPLSSSANLTATSTDTPIMLHVQGMLKTSIIPLVLASLFYGLMGLSYPVMPQTQATLASYSSVLSETFTLVWINGLPIMVLIGGLTLAKQGTLKSIWYAIITTLIIAMVKGLPLADLIKTALFGFHTDHPLVQSLMSGAGLQAMIPVFAVILLAATLNALYDQSQVLKPIYALIDPYTTSYTSLMMAAGLSSFFIMVITCNQSLPAIITGQHYQFQFQTNKIPTYYLARCISDFSIILVALVPWNINALLVYSVTGVSAFHYAPYAFVCYLIPLVSLLSITIENKKIKTSS